MNGFNIEHYFNTVIKLFYGMLRFQNWNAIEDVGEKGQLKLHFLSK